MSNLIKITLFFLTYCYCEAYENNVANNYSFEDDTDGNSIADHVQFRSQAPLIYYSTVPKMLMLGPAVGVSNLHHNQIIKTATLPVTLM